MSNKIICPFCHSTIAPADPTTVSAHGITAHSGCVVRTRARLTGLCLAVSEFFEAVDHEECCANWQKSLRSGRVNSRQSLIRAICCSLRVLDKWRLSLGEEGQFTFPTTAQVSQFRTEMGKELVCEL